MKILVTGGAGFIGHHLANRLAEHHTVVVYDSLYRGDAKRLNSDVEFVKGDVTDFTHLSKASRDVDVIYHLAAISRVLESVKHPKLCFNTNVIGTYNVIEAVREHGCRIIYASSREVYGDAQYLPVDEEHPLNPKNPYGASKLAGEIMIRAMAATYEMQYAIIRLANVYGRGDFSRVIPTFLHNIKEGKDLVIYGSSSKIIDFIYVDDVVDALIACLGIDEQIMNIGSSVGTTLGELADMFTSFKTFKKSFIKNASHKVRIVEGNACEVERFIADIDKARKHIGFKPSIKLRDGIRELVWERSRFFIDAD
uniref:ADP-L-glycero-D-manno-heptose-6-epimerase n=1 Tax=Candidatus Methanophagaceae archaeon ANME-1 ERB6 TaxID=2759912 RepID=A0A7G9YYX0_9EURY|nr:ADP-L-glycero-D-manno-heptose-6-epimerase [Methanosarcinales archaeon ANME-1 ERB6]